MVTKPIAGARISLKIWAVSKRNPPRKTESRAKTSCNSAVNNCQERSKTSRKLRCRSFIPRQSLSRKSSEELPDGVGDGVIDGVNCSTIAAGVKSGIHAAESKRLNGIPCTNRQMVAIASPFESSRRKAGLNGGHFAKRGVLHRKGSTTQYLHWLTAP